MPLNWSYNQNPHIFVGLYSKSSTESICHACRSYRTEKDTSGALTFCILSTYHLSIIYLSFYLSIILSIILSFYISILYLLSIYMSMYFYLRSQLWSRHFYLSLYLYLSAEEWYQYGLFEECHYTGVYPYSTALTNHVLLPSSYRSINLTICIQINCLIHTTIILY
jgi:hypothetical protein